MIPNGQQSGRDVVPEVEPHRPERHQATKHSKKIRPNIKTGKLINLFKFSSSIKAANICLTRPLTYVIMKIDV
jgi:hypothetical protein